MANIKGKHWKTSGWESNLDEFPQKTKSAIKNDVKSDLKDIFDIILPGVNPAVQTSWDDGEPEYTGNELLIIDIKKKNVKEFLTTVSALDYEHHVNNGTYNTFLNKIAESFKRVYHD